jgi:hypothetical protein
MTALKFVNCWAQHVRGQRYKTFYGRNLRLGRIGRRNPYFYEFRANVINVQSEECKNKIYFRLECLSLVGLSKLETLYDAGKA